MNLGSVPGTLHVALALIRLSGYSDWYLLLFLMQKKSFWRKRKVFFIVVFRKSFSFAAFVPFTYFSYNCILLSLCHTIHYKNDSSLVYILDFYNSVNIRVTDKNNYRSGHDQRPCKTQTYLLIDRVIRNLLLRDRVLNTQTCLHSGRATPKLICPATV